VRGGEEFQKRYVVVFVLLKTVLMRNILNKKKDRNRKEKKKRYKSTLKSYDRSTQLIVTMYVKSVSE